MADSNIYYARHEHVVVLKFCGDIRYAAGNTIPLGALLQHLFEASDFSEFLIDLTATEGIDSTNLGLLAKVARHMLERGGSKPVILSTNPDINTVLEAVGFDQVFQIVHDAHPTDLPLESVPEANGNEDNMTRLVLDAHKALAEMNEKNKETFKSVIEVLERETGDGPAK